MQITIDLTPIIERLDRIEAKLEELRTEQKENELLNVEQAAEFLNVSKSTVYKLTSSRTIPHYKPEGKRIFFKRSELQEYATTGRVCSRDELDALAHRLFDSPNRRR